MSKVVSRSEASRLGKRGSYRLGGFGLPGPGRPDPPPAFRPSFAPPQHRGSALGWLLAAILGILLIAAGAMLGLWFIEAAQLVFRWREGKLEARFDRIADWQPSSVFERQTSDRWRTVSGPEHGEALRIERAEDGSITRMIWAGYPVTREPGAWRAPEA